MGQRLVDLISNDDAVHLCGAVESPGHLLLGRDAGEVAGIGPIGVALVERMPPETEVVIDFSQPAGALAIAASCREAGVPVVVATTGFEAAERDELLAIGQTVPMVFAPNMSVAVNIGMMLVRQAARALGEIPGGVDAEVVERHHRFKKDAPSGTALRFGEIIAEQLGQTEHVHGRHGLTGERPRNQIGYHALRTGDNVGEHNIVFGLMGETLSIDVRGHSRDSYAVGAIAAARWLVGKPPGVYAMSDVLGLDA